MIGASVGNSGAARGEIRHLRLGRRVLGMTVFKDRPTQPK